MAIVYEQRIGNCFGRIDDRYCSHLTSDSPEVRQILQNIAQIVLREKRIRAVNGEAE